MASPINSKRRYDVATNRIRNAPQDPKAWLERADGFFQTYPLLAVADAYRALLLAPAVKERRALNLQPEYDVLSLENLRDKARTFLVCALVEMNAFEDAKEFYDAIDTDFYREVIDEKYPDVANTTKSYSVKRKKPKMRLEIYPWMDDSHLSRSEAALSDVKTEYAKLNMRLDQSTVTDTPAVLGLFATKNFKKGKMIAPGFPAEAVCKTEGDYTPALLKHVLARSVKLALEDDGYNPLEDDMMSTLTASYNGVAQAFSFQRNIRDIFDITAPLLHAYYEYFDFWMIMALAQRLDTNMWSHGDTDGVSKLFSFFNHSCDPNAVWDPASLTHIEIKAVKSIKKGEEIFISYADVDSKSLAARRKLLKWWFGCDCNCKLCVKEERYQSLSKRHKR